MSPEETDNPYSEPKSGPDESLTSPRKRPGVLAYLVVICGGIVAAICAFFCTCFGLAFAFEGAQSPGLTLDLLMQLSLLGSLTAFVATWFIGFRVMR